MFEVLKLASMERRGKSHGSRTDVAFTSNYPSKEILALLGV